MEFKEFRRPASHVVGIGDTTPFLWVVGIDTKDIDEKAQMDVLRKQHIAFEAKS